MRPDTCDHEFLHKGVHAQRSTADPELLARVLRHKYTQGFAVMRCLAVLSLASALIPPTRHLSPKTCRAAPDELAATDDDGWTVTLSGLKYQDLVEGTGATASSGKVAVVQYEGKLVESGRVFDSTKGRGSFKFVVGEGSVIPAWDEGVSTMREGGKRKLYCPSRLAYGSAGAGANGEIPGGADLLFDVELESVAEGAVAVQMAKLGLGLNLRTGIAFLLLLTFILPPLFPDVAWLH